MLDIDVRVVPESEDNTIGNLNALLTTGYFSTAAVEAMRLAGKVLACAWRAALPDAISCSKF